MVATQGLIAHGRGEAFDYLIGERTTEEAELAEVLCAFLLLSAERPVISVNGNVGALASEDLSELANLLGCPCEVNIFHRTEERVVRLAEELRSKGCRRVLGEKTDARIPGLDHARALCSKDGIYISDVVLVPLEDGDRCRALKNMGKKVLTIDLNPLSRTARTADITILDNLTRAVPNLVGHCRKAQEKGAVHGIAIEGVRERLEDFDNIENMNRTLRRMVDRFR